MRVKAGDWTRLVGATFATTWFYHLLFQDSSSLPDDRECLRKASRPIRCSRSANPDCLLPEYGSRGVVEMKSFLSFQLDTINHCLWHTGDRVSLTPKAFDVLRYLVEHPGRVVSQDE